MMERVFTFVASKHLPTQSDIKQLLNSIRILTRLLPFIFEHSDLENVLFWTVDASGQTNGHLLVTSALELLYFRGFTLPLEASDKQVAYIIWFGL
jgi:hypothetical protein